MSYWVITVGESCEECSTVGACPFAWTEESDMVQNYGCLPTPYNIITMRVEHKKTWACHSNPTKPCLGALNWLKSHDLPFKVVDTELLTETSDWHYYIRGGEYGEIDPPGYTPKYMSDPLYPGNGV